MRALGGTGDGICGVRGQIHDGTCSTDVYCWLDEGHLPCEYGNGGHQAWQVAAWVHWDSEAIMRRRVA